MADHRILELIKTISLEIAHNPDINLVLESVLNNIQRVLQADRASIMFPDQDSNTLYIKAGRGFEPDVMRSVRLPIAEGIAGYVARSHRPVFLKTEGDYQAFGISPDTFRYRNVSAISIPILYKDDFLGVLNLNDKHQNGSFTETDFLTAQIVASQAAVAINNSVLFNHYIEKIKLQQSFLIAREIQQHFFPKQSPELSGYEIESWAKTCDETGGDYYDYIHYFDHSLAMVIGDVAGHGIGAALVMASARAALHAYVENIDDLQQVFYKLNNLLESNLEYSNFMTLLIVLLDINHGTFRYISAGHEGPIFYNKHSDRFHVFPSCGLPLGIQHNTGYTLSAPQSLQSGDFILLITDGFYEVHHPADGMMGKQRLMDFLAVNRHCSMHELKAAMIGFWQSYRGNEPQEDDISLVLIKKL
ncbi:MAG: SpoIIE family protein phosphatase [Candidatus Delongbacteria bacterium]|nr:SpoIIE family protein phosphatase [Candidatus Delongbacteria bacterium]